MGEIRDKMAQRTPSPVDRNDIHIGDTVRISKVKSVFAKGYFPNWTEEIFTISNINRKQRPIMYKLKDYNNDIIEGSFYRHEIEPVIHEGDVYLVEEVIRRERRGRETWCFVKWRGYPSSMNSWVRQRDMSQVTQRR